MLASQMSACEFDFLAQKIGEILSRFDSAPHRGAVDHRCDLDLVLHAAIVRRPRRVIKTVSKYNHAVNH
jgi:hypothetical protein